MEPKNPSQSDQSALTTFCIIAGSSILFCSKGIFAKLAYRDGADALAVLALRMGFALPFFIAIIILAFPRTTPVTARDLAEISLLGFIGYYLSSVVNFTGLEHVSIGLERIILYTYPTLILVLSVFVLKKSVRPGVWLACAISWLGIATAFLGEVTRPSPDSRTVLGAGLVFLSALTYAIFLMLSARMLTRFGPMFFTGMTVGFSCLFVLLHYGLTRPIGTLLEFTPNVYFCGGMLAFFGTAAPAVLMSAGLKRAGTQNFAIISCIGPVATILLAWGILDEKPIMAQIAGFILTVLGGLMVSRMK